MENNQEKAIRIKKEILDQVQKGLDLRISEWDWEKVTKKKLWNLANATRGFERTGFKQTLKEVIEENYKDEVSYFKNWVPDMEGLNDNSEAMAAWEELKEAIDLVPETLDIFDMEAINKLDVDALEPLRKGLWRFFEDWDVSLGLGDDGTDEMEQSMDYPVVLIGVIQKNFQWNPENLVYNIADWEIRNHILSDYDYPRNGIIDGVSRSVAFLDAVINQDARYCDAVRVVLQEIERDHLK
jgi:hypothetical protein